MESAIGDAVITMDADGQHPPEEIPRMISASSSATTWCKWLVLNGWRIEGSFPEWFYKAFQ